MQCQQTISYFMKVTSPDFMLIYRYTELLTQPSTEHYITGHYALFRRDAIVRNGHSGLSTIFLPCYSALNNLINAYLEDSHYRNLALSSTLTHIE